MIALTASALLTPLERVEQPILLLEGDQIVRLSSRISEEIPAGARLIDFGDVHNHGGAGRDVMEADSAALPAIEKLLLSHGVTGYLPTTVTAPLDRTLE